MGSETTADDPDRVLFLECECGEVWKGVTVPIGAVAFSKALKRRGCCPNCESKKVFLSKEKQARNGTMKPK